MKIFNIALFILLSAACIFARLRGEEEREIKYERWAVLLLLAAALAMRLWLFGAVPEGINQDGAMAAVDGKALGDYGSDRFGMRYPAQLTAWGYGQMSVLLSYLIAPLTRLFGLNVYTMRLPQLIVSMAGLIFLWLFVRECFGKGAGLAALGFALINPWHFLQSRWALDCNLFPHFVMAGLCLLQRGLKSRRLWLYASMLIFGLAMYCYGVSIYTVPLLLLLCCGYLLKSGEISRRETALCAGLYLLISWPLILTMAVNFFKWDSIELPFVTMAYFPNSTRSGDILFFAKEPLKQLAQNAKSLLNVTLLQKKDLPWNDMAGFGTMYLFSMPLLICAPCLLRKKENSRASSLLLIFLFTGICNGLVTGNVNVNRANLIYYPIIILLSLGLYGLIRRLPRLRLPLIGVYALSAALMLSCYFGEYRQSLRPYFYSGFGEALQTAEDSGAEKLYITADVQYDGSVQTAEILTLFYDGTDAKYFQGEASEKLLPYKERFNYVSLTPQLVERLSHEDAALVARGSEASLFEGGEYELHFFGGYLAAVRAD